MVQFNFSERTIKAKVVYYGPPQSGKTTNLEQIHKVTDPEGSNRLISLNTAQDRTLFFDLLPFSLGTVSGYDFKIQLYTVPGQVQYNATRRVVLAGADAVVFVADSQKLMARENVTALENMKVNLLANRLVPEKVPLVLQYNKQDLAGLIPPAELDHTLNYWGRKAFPAVASRGEGVMETFVAVVQEMLAAIAVKYNLKEKGLDPEAVPAIVAEAFRALLQKTPPRPAPGQARVSDPPSPRVVIAQPDGAEPAYPGQLGREASPVSEELLHRAIRSNVDLAETLGHLVRELSLGLGSIQAQLETLGPADDSGHGAALAAARRETLRLRRLLLELGRSAATGPRAAAPPQVGSSTSRLAVASPLPTAAQAGAPAARPPAAPAPVQRTAPATTLDALFAEVATALHAALAARAVTVESRIARGAALPRCSPVGLRRSLAAFVQGLAGLVAPSSTIAVRAERKPVLLRSRDGGEVKREFLMIALSHAGGPSDREQQSLLKGLGAGALGDGQRLLRELGGFLRFAPLPAGALETRLFLPV